MARPSRTYWNYLLDISMMIAGPVLCYYLFQEVLTNRLGGKAQSSSRETQRLESILDAREEEEERAREEAEAIAGDNEAGPSSADRPVKKSSNKLTLTSYEQTIASEVIAPEDIPITFADIGGLDKIIEELQENVIYPLTIPQLYGINSPLLGAPGGVLLYGPPGCGKTMLAKALAHESGAVFINLHISTLTEKWYGDSNKLVRAVFTLARKLAPAIIFVDEIDAVLGKRGMSQSHEASEMVKAEFMTHMDGLTSSVKKTRTPSKILVLGATNRPWDIDEAIWRRMPRRFSIGLPDAQQRLNIFNVVLKDTKIDHGADEHGQPRTLDWDFLVKRSAGMSGSGIKDACRDAAMMPVREYIQQRRKLGEPIRAVKPNVVRGVRTEDFRSMNVNPGQRTRDSGSISSSLARRKETRSKEVSNEQSDDDEYETDHGSDEHQET